MNKAAREIEDRFQKSWEETVNTFKLFENGGFKKYKPMHQFLINLKEQGENSYFRIGTSLYRLFFSRSVERGLRIDQKFIRIDTITESDYEVVFRDGQTTFREYRLSTLNDEKMKNLLKTLKETLID